MESPFWPAILRPLGLVLLASWSYRLFSFVSLHFLHRSTLSAYLHITSNVEPDAQPSRSYALITGASDGIGLGFAEELLASGFHVILHGRNPTKLNKVQAHLQQHHPNRDVRTFIADASDQPSWANAFDSLLDMLKDPTISLKVLVNNVGGSASPHATFSKSLDRLSDATRALTNVNAVFPAAITHALLPALVHNQPSLILNVGSIAGHFPMAYLSLYSSSKAFNSAFSRSLSSEMAAEGLGVEVFNVVVGKTLNQSTGKLKSGFFVPTSRELAKAALDKVGCGGRECVAWWPHELQMTAVMTLPEWARERILLRATKEEMEAEGKNT